MATLQRCIGAIDQGTSSTRFILFDECGRTLASHQVEFPQYTPQNGWVEHCPLEILRSVHACVDAVMARVGGRAAVDLRALGITNQRETTVVWDRETGAPLHRAIVWLDTRTAALCEQLTAAAPGASRDAYRATCGLPISTYFSGVKLRWLLDNAPAVREAADAGRAMFGTIESWLIWNLSARGAHVTDVTNASRTMLLDLRTRDWSASMLAAFQIPASVLPAVKSNSEVYALVAPAQRSAQDADTQIQFGSAALEGVPISGAIGDQQGALLGQLCTRAGEAKNTYGTGCFMLMNTGDTPVQSRHGLLTTIGFQLGPTSSSAESTAPAPVVCYALEGSIAIAGAAVKWLRDNLGLIREAAEVESLARAVPDSGGVVFVPAFSGLFAPHWREDARGVLCGLTQYSTRHHIARAVLEAICFQVRFRFSCLSCAANDTSYSLVIYLTHTFLSSPLDLKPTRPQVCEVMNAMHADSGVRLRRLRVDGGMTANALLLQTQADLLGITVERAHNAEATAFGAAIAAGLAVGVWRDTNEVASCVATATASASASSSLAAASEGSGAASQRLFESSMSDEVRSARMQLWSKAVARSLDWVEKKPIASL
jgi:glycerol kinase